MRRREFMALLGGASAWPAATRAQQKQASTTRVAFLGPEAASTNQHFVDAFRLGMREHGYVDGQSIDLQERWAEGQSERFPALISEVLIRRSMIDYLHKKQ